MLENILFSLAYILNTFENPYLFGVLIGVSTLGIGLVSRQYSVAYFVSLSLTFILIHGTKSILMVPRPEDALVFAVGYRFPSMHAGIASAIITSGAYYLWMYTDNTWMRTLLTVGALSIIVVVSYTRVVLNVHEVIDVVVGSLMGVSISILAHIIMKRYGQ